MRRLAVLLVALAFLGASMPAAAGGWRGHHGGHHGHFKFHGHGHGDGAAFLVGGLIGGLILGHLLTRPAYYEPAPRVVYSPPPLDFTNCVETTGTGFRDGRRTLYSGVLCTDRYGRSYIRNDSIRFLGYLD